MRTASLLCGLLLTGPALGQTKEIQDKIDQVLALCKEFQSGDNAAKVRIATKLADLGQGASAAAPTLVDGLAVANEDVRLNAALALGKIGKGAIKPLQETLSHKDANARFYAVWALAWIGPDASATAPQVIRLLADDNDNVRRKAAYTLGRIAPVPDTAIKELIKAFGDKSPEVRAAAGEAVAHFGAAAVPALRRVLKDDVESVRIQAIHTLASLKHDAKPALDDLKTIFLTAQNNISFPASTALAAIGKDAIAALKEGLKAERDDIRQSAVRGLAKVGADAVPDLVDALAHTSVEVRREAAQHLGAMNIADKMVVLGLAYATADSDLQVRMQALSALQRLGPGAKLAAPKVVAALGDANDNVRRTALYTLARIGGEAEAVLPALTKLAKDPDVQIRTTVLQMLPTYGKDALPLVLDSLRDAEPRVRMQAAFALGRVSGDLSKAVPKLGELVQDADPVVRAAAVAALGRGGEEALPHLKTALADPTANVRAAAALALGSLGPSAKKLGKELLALAENDSGILVRRNALQTLGTFGDDYLPQLIGMLKGIPKTGKTATLGMALIQTLGNFGPKAKDAVPDLIEALDSKVQLQLRWSAAQALGSIGPDAKAAIPALERAAQDPNQTLRNNATTALVRIRVK
ncbi:MAG: HEAT repeat domain-containing protein [Gemmataceae bacterium]|nr:HEAT repeat domain-containing protein [Gemmataceae bacterium]MCI0739457.1 HEAT repeat domain-containing protein [Gemmataceae bacterium]